MSTSRLDLDQITSSRLDTPRSVRWRVWAAVSVVVLLPTLAGIYGTSALLDTPDSTLIAERARETSESAAALVARELDIESRLLAAAAEPALARLFDGIDGGGERQVAAHLLRDLRGADGAIITGACLSRTGDGRQVPLALDDGGLEACAESALLEPALAAPAGSVMRTAAGDGSALLTLATPVRSANERVRGVLSAEVDVATLFDRTRMLGGAAVTSMLVDMGSSQVVAADPATAGPAGSVPAAALAAVMPHLPGIVEDDGRAAARVADLGVAPTVVPLWTDSAGARLGLVQLWPAPHGSAPLEVGLALAAMLVGAVISLILLVRYVLRPFQRATATSAKLEVLYREAREDALADGLTGLGNHRAFQEELGRQVAAFEQRGTPFSLVLMDLDDLKVVNDRDGHAAGDEMLVSMSRTMRDLIRGGDLLYRTGGDEFAIVLPGTEIEDAVTTAERILHFCKRPPGGGRPSPFSAGVSGVPTFARQRDLVYRQADAALYWAKRHGRGSVEVFEPERDPLPYELTDANASAVAEVITGKLLHPVFQPIVDLRTGQVLGFEGLIRPDPSGPLPDTTRLFAAAAASGRTVELDLACIEAVVHGARAIGQDRLLTINLSPRTLEVKDFDAAWLLSGLVRNGISPSRVIVELTERETVDDLDRLQQTFNMLQQYGLRLAADDVGAGNSGLRLLSQVQFDIVKIDLALVQDGVRRMGARAVLQSIRDLALSQNARIVAEGVETARQLQLLRELDIGAGQGFLLGRPDASVDMDFVDVRELASGAIVPDRYAPAPLPSGAVTAAEVVGIPYERRAIFLPPPRPRLGVDPLGA